MSKEMLELAYQLAARDLPPTPKWGCPLSNKANVGVFTLTTEQRDMIVAALRASAVAEPEPHDPSQYCRLDACKREGCTRLAHMCLSKQPHPTPATPVPNLQGKLAGSPAAPVPASVRELATKLLDFIDAEGPSAREWEAISSTAEALRTAIASLPAPEAAPTREEQVLLMKLAGMIEQDQCGDLWDMNDVSEEDHAKLPDLLRRIALKAAPAK